MVCFVPIKESSTLIIEQVHYSIMNVFAKYGRARKIKYLVSSLEDLKDVVETVRQMIGKHCDKDDLKALEDSITLDALPIKNSLSAFILDLRMPQYLLEPDSQTSKFTEG